MKEFSHIDKNGNARMVDVSPKPPVARTALARGKICLQKHTLQLVRDNAVEKGDVLAVARIAGILGGKKTSDLIPLCHNIEIEHIRLDLEIENDGILIEAETRCTDKTGIEMEALTAVSVAALTIYDMCKAVDEGMEITDIRLIEKTKNRV